MKKFLIFQEMEFSSHKIRNFLTAQEGTCIARKTNKKIHSAEIFYTSPKQFFLTFRDGCWLSRKKSPSYCRMAAD